MLICHLLSNYQTTANGTKNKHNKLSNSSNRLDAASPTSFIIILVSFALANSQTASFQLHSQSPTMYRYSNQNHKNKQYMKESSSKQKICCFTKRIKKHQPDACSDQDLSTINQILQIDSTSTNISNILKIANPHLNKFIADKKKIFNNLIKDYGSYEDFFQEQNDIISIKAPRSYGFQNNSVVRLKLSQPLVFSYFNTTISILDLRIATLQSCLLSFIKALKAYQSISQSKAQSYFQAHPTKVCIPNEMPSSIFQQPISSISCQNPPSNIFCQSSQLDMIKHFQQQISHLQLKNEQLQVIKAEEIAVLEWRIEQMQKKSKKEIEILKTEFNQLKKEKEENQTACLSKIIELEKEMQVISRSALKPEIEAIEEEVEKEDNNLKEAQLHHLAKENNKAASSILQTQNQFIRSSYPHHKNFFSINYLNAKDKEFKSSIEKELAEIKTKVIQIQKTQHQSQEKRSQNYHQLNTQLNDIHSLLRSISTQIYTISQNNGQNVYDLDEACMKSRQDLQIVLKQTNFPQIRSQLPPANKSSSQFLLKQIILNKINDLTRQQQNLQLKTKQLENIIKQLQLKHQLTALQQDQLKFKLKAIEEAEKNKKQERKQTEKEQIEDESLVLLEINKVS